MNYVYSCRHNYNYSQSHLSLRCNKSNDEMINDDKWYSWWGLRTPWSSHSTYTSLSLFIWKNNFIKAFTFGTVALVNPSSRQHFYNHELTDTADARDATTNALQIWEQELLCDWHNPDPEWCSHELELELKRGRFCNTNTHNSLFIVYHVSWQENVNKL